MAASVIGALRVNLGLNSASFRSGLKKSNDGLARFAKAASVGFAAASAAATGAFYAIGKSADEADRLSKSSKSLGVPIDELGRLKYAAELSGVEFAGLSTAIKKTSQAAGQAFDGLSNEATRSFEKLGVSITDGGGHLRGIEDIIADVADKFQAMPDGVDKTALAMSLFGESGADIIPLLNEGSAGLKRMGDEAEKLGLVFDQQTGAASEQFNDNITRMTQVFTGLWNRVLKNVIPAFTMLTDKFSAAAVEGKNVDAISNLISRSMIVLAKGISIAFDHMGHLYDLFKLWIGLRIVFFTTSVIGGFYQLARALTQVGLALKVTTSITRAKITAVLLLGAVIAKITGKYEDLVSFVKQAGQQIYSALPESMKSGLDSVGSALNELTSSIDANRTAAAGALEAFIEVEKKVANSVGRVAKSSDAAGKSVSKLKNESKSASLIWKNFEAMSKRVHDNIAETAKKSKGLTDGLGESFNTMGSGLRGLIDGTSTWQEGLYDVLAVMAKVAAQQLILNSFGGPAGGGGADGGGGVIGNLLTSFVGGLFGFAHGGQFRVGGYGGTDSQLVQFKASPDEVVSVTTPAQQRAMDSESSLSGGLVQYNSINVTTPDVRSFKASEQQLAGRLAAMTRRGGRQG